MRELIEGPDSGSKSNSTANDSVGDRPLSVYKCNQANAKDDEFGCDKPTVKELKSSDFPGTRQYVLKHLIGESGVYSPNSLIGKLTNCTQEAGTNNNICGFTAEQKNIIEVAKGVPLLTLLKRGQGDMNTTLYIAQILAPLVTEDYTLRMMETMITVVGEAYRDVELSVPQTVQGNIQSLRLELQQAQTQYANRMASVKAAVELVNHAVSQAPGMWMSLPSSVGISPRQ